MEAAARLNELIDEHQHEARITPRPPGIYFNLPEDEYHRDPSLGSTDMRLLANNPSDYWWNSFMNPARPIDSSTPAKVRGTAVHCLVLYGEAEFDRRYMRGAVHEEYMSGSEKGAATKAANAKARAEGKIALPAETYDAVAIAGAMIAKNPKLANALVGGMNEVSIFWTDNGLAKKARIDCLKPRGVGDLKSLANQYKRPFPKACIEAISNYRYDVQAQHYLAARAMLPQLVADGCVHGDHDHALLKATANIKRYGWQFVFWQAEGAPITYSKTISPGNPILEVAQSVIERAQVNYKEYRERFGESMWLLEEEPSELFIEDMPPWWGRD